ncbi:hypothetical protein Bca101_067682 [Brassica carinata]
MSSSQIEKSNSDVKMGEASPNLLTLAAPGANSSISATPGVNLPTSAIPGATPSFVAVFLFFKDKLSRLVPRRSRAGLTREYRRMAERGEGVVDEVGGDGAVEGGEDDVGEGSDGVLVPSSDEVEDEGGAPRST